MSNREFDALYPRRETEFESIYEPGQCDEFDYISWLDAWIGPFIDSSEPGEEVNTEDELLTKIEEARQEMNRLAECLNYDAQEVLKQSEKLDDLLNCYYQMKARNNE